MTFWLASGAAVTAVRALLKAYAVDDLVRRLCAIQLEKQHWPLLSRVGSLEGRLAGQSWAPLENGGPRAWERDPLRAPRGNK
jgi:hypothetical protein